MASSASATPPTGAHHISTAARVRAILGSSSGNLVEWYDFYIYAFTAIYFASTFFKKGDQTTELLQAAAIFAIGFLMRPIGSWYFGRLADRAGRKHSMVVSIIMMCAGSLMIAVLPGYESIGIAAPALLLLARMLQGFSVGGEYGATATYMSEVATDKNRGFLSSFQYVTLIGGQLLASLVLVILLQILSKDQMQAWGWRIPFVIGAVLAVVAMFLRKSLVESASKKALSDEKAGTLSELFKYPRSLLIVIGYTAAGSLSFYTFTTYMQKYLVNTAHFSKDAATYVMTAALFVFMLIQPAIGALSDRIGRRNSLLIWSTLGLLGTVPVMTALGVVKDSTTAFMLIMAAMFVMSFYTSIAGIVKAEMFPMHVRALGTGLSYAIANSVFGGSAEYVALQLKQLGHEDWFYWYVAGMMALALISALLMKDSRTDSYMLRDRQDWH